MVISIALLYFGFNFLKGIDFFSTSNKYYVIYQNVDKLTESNSVYLNGLAVGRVSNIQIQQNKNRVIVELDIESGIMITDSSSAELNGELLGGRFVVLNVNPKGNLLEPKDTIHAAIAKGMLDFAQPIALTLQETLKHLNELVGGLSKNMGRIDTMFIGLKQTPGLLNKTLATANSNIGNLSGEFKVVAGNINTTLSELKPTLANFKTLSDSLKMMELNGTLNKAQESLAKLNETLSRLNKGDNTASKLMTEDSLYVNLNRLLVTIDSLASHFNNNPKHFMSPLGKSRKKIERELKEQTEKKK